MSSSRLDDQVKIDRKRTALARTALSRPMERAIFDGFVKPGVSVFDYGCGRGGDIERLAKLEVDVTGFDPGFRPDVDPVPADVVNLGFVVNVIEDQAERAEVLRKAWDLTESMLVVSARLHDESRGLEGTPCRDGLLTDRDTFQKFYEQNELREWILQEIGIEPVAAEPGIFYVFREPAEAQLYRLTRIRRSRPVSVKSKVIFEENEELLNELITFYEDKGRLPQTGEFPRLAELRKRVGTPRQAFRIIKNLTDEERWDRIRVSRYEDLLVFLALSGFHTRPRLSELPTELQLDIKDHFGSYKAACDQAERALHAIGNQNRIKEALEASRVGKRLPKALYVHTSAVPSLPTSLRVLDGCAQELLGSVSEGSIVKFDAEKPRVVYLEYPDFDSDAHPQLRGAYSVNLRTLRAQHADYSKRQNPPILHRKEHFVSESYSGREAFAKLTQKEIEIGLFKDPSLIGLRNGWQTILEAAGVMIVGHEVKKIRIDAQAQKDSDRL